ncbi:MAG: ACP S-malonyltransferase [Bacteroidota bacterium]
MNAYVFPGQGAQFEGMGKDLYESSPLARQLMEQANDILGFKITDVMFEGSAEELKETKVTQPAIFLHSIVKARMAGEAFRPDVVAGHSLGEFSALVASNSMSFEDGLKLVQQRADAMQKACELTQGTMAAVIGLDDEVIEKICEDVEGTVVPANYNCPGQLVISGEQSAVEAAIEKLKEAGARRALLLKVGGAFHSPLMEPAKVELERAIQATPLKMADCPVYQNVTAMPVTDPEIIKKQLIEQLTAPVRWTQTMQNMIDDGVNNVVEVGGNGKVLTGFFRRIDRKLPAVAI